MGISIEQYRATVGSFLNNSTPYALRQLVSVNLSLNVLLAIILLFSLYKLLFLFLCGDVELNPGPDEQSERSFQSFYSKSYSSDLLDYSLDTSVFIKKYISIVHLNVRSLLPKIDQLSVEFQHFDIIALTETFLDNSIPNENISIPGYQEPFRQDRNRHGGGVAIYCRNGLAVTQCLEFQKPSIESIWLKIKYKNTNFMLACLYRPPTENYSFWEKLYESISLVKDNNNLIDFFLVGDLNSDYLNENSNLRILTQFYNLSQIISEPTRIPSNTLLDPILTNAPHLITQTGTLDPFCSDHKPVYTTLTFQKIPRTTYKRKIWIYEQGNYDAFRNSLKTMNWDLITSDDHSIHESVTLFTNKLTNTAQEHIPHKQCTIRTNDKPWMTNTIRRHIRKRRRIHKKAKRSNNETDWTLFRNQRNHVTSLIRQAKTDYHDRSCKKINTDIDKTGKEWWRLCKSVSFQKSQEHTIPPLLHNDQLIYDNEHKAHAINEYFASISNVDTNTHLSDQTHQSPSTLENIEITQQDVHDIILTLKIHKACGIDGISHRLLHESVTYISQPLCTIFNRSLKLGIFPDTWKLANIAPIYKSKETNLIKNYRPISLLSCLSKLFERCVLKYFHNYLINNYIISLDQSAFTAGDGTVNQLVNIHDVVCKALDEGNDIQMIFFDISKAFDRVWHDGLLCKLNCIGIKGHLFDWFKSYLTNRKQRVVIQGSSSSFLDTQAGVPQGSVLGPILFLIYINDITKNITSTTKLYADDTSIYDTIIKHHENESYIILQNDLNIVNSWAEKWMVNFNPQKTEAMFITRKHDENIVKSNLYFQTEKIQDVTNHKHIGLIHSSDATWKTHLSNIISKAAKRIDILRALKWKLDRKPLETLYLSFIRPLFEYGDIVWDCAPLHQYIFQNIEKLQLEASRVVTGTTRYASKILLYNETGWLPLSTRRTIHRLTLFYKIINNECPKHLNTKFEYYNSNRTLHNTRNANNLPIPLCKTETYRYSFFPSSIRLWNTLEPSIRSANSLGSFKSKLQTLYNNQNSKDYYYLGSRKHTSLMASIRTNCSQLHTHLFLNGLSENRYCTCGSVETPYHYFLECKNYTLHRDTLFMKSWNVSIVLNLKTILYGYENKEIVKK